MCPAVLSHQSLVPYHSAPCRGLVMPFTPVPCKIMEFRDLACSFTVLPPASNMSTAHNRDSKNFCWMHKMCNYISTWKSLTDKRCFFLSFARQAIGHETNKYRSVGEIQNWCLSSLLFLNSTLPSVSHPKGKALPSYLNFILHYWFMNLFRGMWNGKNTSS